MFNHFIRLFVIISFFLVPHAQAMNSLDEALHQHRIFVAPILREARFRERAARLGILRAEQLFPDKQHEKSSRSRISEDIEDAYHLSPTGRKICFYNSETNRFELRNVGTKESFASIELCLPDSEAHCFCPEIEWSEDEKFLAIITHVNPDNENRACYFVLINLESGEQKIISEMAHTHLTDMNFADVRGLTRGFQNKIFWYGKDFYDVTYYYEYDILMSKGTLVKVFPMPLSDLTVLQNGTPQSAEVESDELHEFFVWEDGEFVPRYAITRAQKTMGYRFLLGNHQQVLTLQPIQKDKIGPVLVEFNATGQIETPLLSPTEFALLRANVSDALANPCDLRQLLFYSVETLRPHRKVLGDWSQTILERSKDGLMAIGVLSDTIEKYDISADGTRLLMAVESPDRPKVLRICDNVAGELRTVEEFSPTPWVEPLQGLFSPTQTCEYTSFDGLKIPAIFTRPKNASLNEKLPTILLVHGGPEQRDEWVFNPQVQYLANRRFQVLQPQFRGSKGFGLKYKKAIFGHWEDSVKDVIAGRNWLVDQGLADPDRFVVMGGSFGGWLTLQTLTDYPGLFRCGIAICPETDPERTFMNPHMSPREREYWIRQYGKARPETAEGKAKLRQYSPLQNAWKFQDPVLLMHGDKDPILSVDQSVLLAERLKDFGKRHMFIRFPNEGHGNSSHEALWTEFSAVDNFLARYVGSVPCESLEDELRKNTRAILVSHKE